MLFIYCDDTGSDGTEPRHTRKSWLKQRKLLNHSEMNEKPESEEMCIGGKKEKTEETFIGGKKRRRRKDSIKYHHLKEKEVRI